MPHNRFVPASRRGGFTMAEILIVLVVAAILLMVGVPAMTNWVAVSSARTASNEVLSDLQYTRLKAVENGTLASFRIVSSTSYVITVDRTTATDTIKRVNLTQTHPGATLTPTTGRIAFDQRGLYRSGSSTVQQVMVTKGSNYKTLQVLTLGGIRRVN